MSSSTIPAQTRNVVRKKRIARGISERVGRELEVMKKVLGEFKKNDFFDVIESTANSYLRTIGNLIQDGRILPQCALRLSPKDPHRPGYDKTLRIGVFPTAANPFHWMHLLSGLMAMSQYALDKVVYIIAGSDPRKLDLLPAGIRSAMGQDIIELFSPLFACSPIAIDTSLDGETNIFRILQLNSSQRIDAFYIVGTDHYHRFHPLTGSLDTIQKLENNICGKTCGYNERMHSISVKFLDRGGCTTSDIDTFLDVEIVRGTPIEVSSTEIREALGGHGTIQKLAALPYTAFAAIGALGLYAGVRSSRAAPRSDWLRQRRAAGATFT